MLIEDTHTSIDMFRAGWKSVYVNEPGEHLSECMHQPNSIAWRVKQVLRWHQGAVQLLFFKGIGYTSFGMGFPTFWHRVYDRRRGEIDWQKEQLAIAACSTARCGHRLRERTSKTSRLSTLLPTSRSGKPA